MDSVEDSRDKKININRKIAPYQCSIFCFSKGIHVHFFVDIVLTILYFHACLNFPFFTFKLAELLRWKDSFRVGGFGCTFNECNTEERSHGSQSAKMSNEFRSDFSKRITGHGPGRNSIFDYPRKWESANWSNEITITWYWAIGNYSYYGCAWLFIKNFQFLVISVFFLCP